MAVGVILWGRMRDRCKIGLAERATLKGHLDYIRTYVVSGTSCWRFILTPAEKVHRIGKRVTRRSVERSTTISVTNEPRTSRQEYTSNKKVRNLKLSASSFIRIVLSYKCTILKLDSQHFTSPCTLRVQISLYSILLAANGVYCVVECEPMDHFLDPFRLVHGQ